MEKNIKVLAAALGISIFALSTNSFSITVKATEPENVQAESTQTESTESDNTQAETSEDNEYAELHQNNTVMYKGLELESTLDGNYFAENIPGLAVITPVSELQRQADFMILEYFFVSTWDIFESTAPQCIETMRIVAESQGAVLGSAFQMKVSRLFSNKVYPYENDELKVGTRIEIPGIYKSENSKYAIVCVKAGGSYEILPDLDDEQDTITFNAHAGTGAYGIIRYL